MISTKIFLKVYVIDFSQKSNNFFGRKIIVLGDQILDENNR